MIYSCSSNSFSRWASYDIFLFKYHFLLHILRYLFFFSDNIMADVASKQQTTALFLSTTDTRTRRHTELTKKLINLMGNLCCAREHSVQFFVQLFLHSLTLGVWGPLNYSNLQFFACNYSSIWNPDPHNTAKTPRVLQSVGNSYLVSHKSFVLSFRVPSFLFDTSKLQNQWKKVSTISKSSWRYETVENRCWRVYCFFYCNTAVTLHKIHRLSSRTVIDKSNTSACVRSHTKSGVFSFV